VPVYEYGCQKCGKTEDIVHGMGQCDDVFLCKNCGVRMSRNIVAVAVHPPADAFWEYENGGRGRHISQLELPLEEKVDAGLNIRQNDNFAYCRSRQEIVEKAARRGSKIVSGAPRGARSIKSK
jgi:putative FmdB family regulatory protein